MRHLRLPAGWLLSLTDAAPPPVPWRMAFPDAGGAQQGVLARHVAEWLPDGLFHTRFTVHALVREGRIMLVDAGLGPGPSAYFDGLEGQLPAQMQAAGLDPADVDLMLFTHFHLDHVGWAQGTDGEPFFPNARFAAPFFPNARFAAPFFPNARFAAPEAEIALWRGAGQAGAPEPALPHHVDAWRRAIEPLVQSGRLDAAEPGAPVAAGLWSDVRFKAAHGHTAGHSAVVIGAGNPALISGDAWHSPVQIAEPSLRHRADRDRARAEAAHRDLATWAHDHGALVCSGHFPEHLAFGRIRLDAEGRATFAAEADAT